MRHFYKNNLSYFYMYKHIFIYRNIYEDKYDKFSRY